MSSAAPAAPLHDSPAARRKVLVASLVGTTIEWYDFFLYATAAGLVFPALFFPSDDPTVGTLLAFGTFAVGFVARPVGAVIFGHVGDRVGRKKTLVVTMLLMGVATALIGLLPSYAAIGVAAPLLLVLLRILQGVAVGGEWGGAVLLAVENAPKGRRGLYASVPQIGLGLGLALGTGAFALLAEFLDDDAFLSWGWRSAFVVSVLLVVVGLAVRLTILETPEFRRLQETGTTTKVPAVELFRTREHRRGLGTGLLARWAEGAAFNTWGVFVITYAVSTAGVDRVLVLVAVTAGALLMAVVTPLAGLLADRYGRRVVFGTGAVLFGLTVIPSFQLVGTGVGWLVVVVLLFQLGVAYALMTGTQSALYAELFDADVRYTGLSLVYQVSGIYASGLTPAILTALLAAGAGSPWLAGGYLALTAVISVVTVWVMPRYIGWRPEWTRTEPW
ncbi:major facilitator transporter [Pseudonocardia sp. EC080610-09]|uniref:MFS transporter n=1 Tax=unclassified Pseudonocardia TaxID=2619320 RepID=UPI0006CB58EE|nr:MULTISPECIES: MFS transporter [unclassified Pseudonocardia]ALE72871.1 major facilitator transporter [Pseudonocardia sp. EC080625-04]ALL76195.1 major facilitator transporter [Pseudonocardia sp. EC080610-09]